MAEITLNCLRDISWSQDSVVRLYVGSEGAVDLANSTPVGGTILTKARAWQGLDQFGFGADPFGSSPFGLPAVAMGFGEGEFGAGAFGIDLETLQMTATYRSSDPTAVLPVGLAVVDAAGNVSLVAETLVQLDDPPQGPRGVALEQTSAVGEAKLTWSESPDV